MYNREGTDAFKNGEDLSALFERKASALRAKLEARAAAGGGGGGGGSAQRRASSKDGVLAQMQQMQQTMAAGGMGGMMGGMGACMGMLPGMAAGGAQQPAAADTNGSGAAHGGKGARAGAGRGPNEEMSHAIKATLSQQIGKLKGGQMSKVIDIMKRDPGFAAHAAGGADGEARKLDLDALQGGTLWKLNDYVTAVKGVNARKKVAPISKCEQLGMARARAQAWTGAWTGAD
ncbi:hypothetical protein KFE25_011204 [Diacronema lutheri]|uniref:NET domain-containing protein n=1 Tax=Diacronema lutheri TaxID=2081491 RepID=A0A8J6C641_DIALT|nr:hypothetical protein KFE25_011204 [Diacronema lutheri]